ncbi:MAG: response regulator [Synergistaceae bacterium]|nr:response regulator [Synergistaceae bacterium]
MDAFSTQSRYLRLLLASNSNAVMLLDKDGYIEFLNDRMVRTIAAPARNGVEGLHFTELYGLFESETFVENARRAFKLLQKKMQFLEEELEIDFSGTGHPRPYVVHSIPLVNEDGVFEGAEVIFFEPASLVTTLTERQTHVLLDFVPLPWTLRDSDNRIVDCNQEALRMFGVSRKEDLIERFQDFIPEFQPDGERSDEKFAKVYRAAVESGHHDFEWTYLDAKGEPLPVEALLVRLLWRSGYCFVVYSRDLRKEREQAEKAKEAEQQIQAMMDATPLLASLWDGNGQMLNCNLEALRLLKVPRKSDYMDRFYELSPEFQPDGERSREKGARMIRAAFETGRQRFNWMYKASDGELLPVETTLVRIPWRGGFGLAAYSRDMREIIEKEEETRDANERVQTMLDSMTSNCIFFDPNGEPEDCNEQVISFFGCRDKQKFLENFSDFSPEVQPDGRPSREKALDMIHRAYSTGHAMFYWEHCRADGEPLPVEVTLKRVKWRDGWRVIGHHIDLREIQEANQRSSELEIESKAAQAASEAKSAFLATMSHEIRTPMNAIIGMSDLMRTDNLDDQQKEYLRDIRKTSHALLQIINDILDLSKIEAGKMELVQTNYSIRAIYDDICAITLVTMKNKPLQFHHFFSADVPDILFGDETRVRQIITNILNNAVKYTEKGHVELRVTRELWKGRDCLVVVVSDTGIGIKKENLSRLFDKFAQFDVDKHKGINGTGLGLPITKQLVELMEGEIVVESDYGRGSTFTIYLPLTPGDPAKIERPKTLRRVSAQPGTEVLVVDDNAINLTVALGYLAKHGIKADKAESGEQALEMLRNKTYDLILMDHMMPEMDGIETTRRIRATLEKKHREMPIVALSANALSGMKQVFLDAGMDDFISKPIDPLELNRTLLEWLPPEKLILSSPEAAGEKGEAKRGEAHERDKSPEPDATPGAAPSNASSSIASASSAPVLREQSAGNREALSKFLQNRAGDADAIAALLEAGDLEGAARFAHSLRNMAAAMGAERLRLAASRAETAISSAASSSRDGVNAGGTGKDGPSEAPNGELKAAMTELSLALGELRKVELE